MGYAATSAKEQKILAVAAPDPQKKPLTRDYHLVFFVTSCLGGPKIKVLVVLYCTETVTATLKPVKRVEL